MTAIGRKIRREQQVQARKALRQQVKDQHFQQYMQDMFKRGSDVGYIMAHKTLLERLQVDGVITQEQFDEYAKLGKEQV